jgi:hypothetical protein
MPRPTVPHGAVVRPQPAAKKRVMGSVAEIRLRDNRAELASPKALQITLKKPAKILLIPYLYTDIVFVCTVDREAAITARFA